VVGRLDDWLAELFSPANFDQTCQALATASRSDPADDQRRAAQQVLVDCQRRLDRYLAALEAGTDPAVVQEWIAEVATRAAAESQLRDSRTAPDELTPEQVRGLLEQAGGLSASMVSTTLTATPCTSRRSSVGVLVVSEGGLEPPRPMRALGPQPGQRCLPRPA
jgi:hypothetical protein